jgi:hypothetical protein
MTEDTTESTLTTPVDAAPIDAPPVDAAPIDAPPVDAAPTPDEPMVTGGGETLPPAADPAVQEEPTVTKVWNKDAQCWVDEPRIPEPAPAPPAGKRWNFNAQVWE